MTPQPPPAGGPPTSEEKSRRVRIWSAGLILALLALTGLVLGLYFAFTAFIPDPLTKDAGFDAQEIAAQDLAIARMETQALRNAFAVTGGLSVLVALVVTIRRQLHHERTTAKSQADEQRRQDHLEEDALQRRITDSRIRAVEQLGSDNPAVRIGGLHNLERIGQQHDELRQVVLDEVCAYLRRAYTPPRTATPTPLSARQFEPVGPPPAEAAAGDDEGEVRRTAQEILQRHLNPSHPELYWEEHTRLNLRNAHLDTIDFRNCHLNQADFTEAFTGDASFGGATFTGNASFGGATFTGDTYFGEATFTGNAYFGDATFGDATFEGNEGATFGVAYFGGATFTRTANFADATFTGNASFADARLHSALRGVDLALLTVLRKGEVRVRLDIKHELPEGWGLDPVPATPGWGHLVDQSEAGSVGGGT
jgi:hypothetical protein